MSHHFTVGDLVQALQGLPDDLQVRLAVQPDWPFAHFVAPQIVSHDGAVYIAEAGQADYLPRPVAESLAWV
ncbi:hypothetical protein [Streptomyces cellulosae]|jgi:hypothetical protein|uniref:hypothetical protein n=1 Tax=Streptomyces sp. P9-2 TaxID=3423201 RepID=UPI00167BF5DB|nr:hypothetical protein GCM10018771_39610 [Streptomyces cellulosae]